MRLLVDGLLSASGHGGLVTVVRCVTNALAERPLDLHVALPANEGGAPAEATVWPMNIASTVQRVRAQTIGLDRLARRLQPDLVLHFNPVIGTMGAGVPRAVIVPDFRHRVQPSAFSRSQRWYRRTMWPRAVRSADVLFCISQQTRQELDQFGGRIRRPVTVLPMGSDHVDSWAQSRKSSVTNPYVLHLAHRANKRPLLAIEAFLAASNRVDDSDRWRLVIVGLDDDRLRHLRRTHPRLVQDPRLRFFPPLEAREFSQVFAAAGCLLFTSEYEGYGLPVLEAARLGVSVVTTPVPAVTEGDVTGALVASGASSQIANLLGTVLSGEHDPSVAKRAVTDLVWARTADVLIDQLHEHLREIS